METDRLIRMLAADGATPATPMARVWMLAIFAAAVLAGIAFFAWLGPRPDIVAAAATPRFLFKFVATLALFSTALASLVSLARPGAPARPVLFLLFAPALLSVAVAVETMLVPADQLGARWVGSNAALCMTFIPLIGLGPLVAFLLALRHGAPTRPTLAGAVAGLVAGGLAATFYAAHCTDDSPLFVATWYSLAVAILGLAGAAVGRIWLRW